MTDKPTSPRLWRGLGLGAAALGLATGPAAALTPSATDAPAGQPLLWQVQAESGEAGEAAGSGEQGESSAPETGEQGETGEAPAAEAGEAGEAGEADEAGAAPATQGGEAGEAGKAGEAGEAGLAGSEGSDSAYATRLLLLDAHLRSALAAQQAGRSDDAEELVEEAEELLEELEDDLEERGVAGLTEDGIESLEEALASGSDAQAAFDAVSTPVFEALASLPPRARFDALLAVTRGAAEEHEAAADEPEALLEAQAYLASARALADRLAEDAAVAEAGAAAAQALSEAETQLAESPEDTTILPAAAARVELAGLQVP